MINHLFPFLDSIGSVLSDLVTPPGSLVIWGLGAGSIAGFLYYLTSPQQKILATKGEMEQLRKELRAAEDDPKKSLSAALRNVSASFRYLGLISLPTVVSIIPVLLVSAWLDAHHSYRWPEKTEIVTVSTTPPLKLPLRIEVQGAKKTGEALSQGELELVILDSKVNFVSLGGSPAASIQKRMWWNFFLESELGYLADNSPVEEVILDLPRLEYIPYLPNWLAGWEIPFFLAVASAFLALKFLVGFS